MTGVAVDRFEALDFEPMNLEYMTSDEHNMEAADSHSAFLWRMRASL